MEDPSGEVMPVELLPVNAGNKPVKLILRERPGFVACPGPAEMSFMQTTNAQPDAVPVPAQHLYARAGLVGKDERCAFMPRGFQLVLYILCQCVDPTAHINGLYSQEDIFRRQHNVVPGKHRLTGTGDNTSVFRRGGGA